MIKSVAEMENRRQGVDQTWACQAKDRNGRLRATCSRVGKLPVPKGNGKRDRPSDKCDCNARINSTGVTPSTVPAQKQCKTTTWKVAQAVWNAIHTAALKSLEAPGISSTEGVVGARNATAKSKQ
jgi:hypothetical protein